MLTSHQARATVGFPPQAVPNRQSILTGGDVALEIEKKYAQEEISGQASFISIICEEITYMQQATDSLKKQRNAMIGLLHAASEVAIPSPIKEELLDLLKSEELGLEGVDSCVAHEGALAEEASTLLISGESSVLKEDVFCPIKVIHNVAKILAEKRKEKKLKLNLILPDLDCQVRGDALRVRQILLNLLNNAIKFTEQGEINIKLSIEEGEGGDKILTFSISDTGIGMTPDEKSKIFGRFEQANEKIANLYGGSGLGLPICKDLIERMGGKIAVQSTKNVGSTFTFDIKCQDALSPRVRVKAMAVP